MKIQTSKADLMITPDLSPFNLVDTSQVDDLIEEGYREAKKVLTWHSAGNTDLYWSNIPFHPPVINYILSLWIIMGQ